MLENVLNILPDDISREIRNINSSSGITEIRLRVGKKGIIVLAGTELHLSRIIKLEDLLEILVNISKNSIYAIQNEINNGFVVIKGGHRIGVCGEVVMQDGNIKNIKNISSMNIRIARELIGCADKIMPYIINENRIKNTLIVSPPGCGKTTILRDAVRQISNGVRALGFNGCNVGLVDERGEIASVSYGINNLDVGNRTDILSNIPKSKGMEMLVRSMGISVIATDEVGSESDVQAIKYASLSGVNMIFTMHGSSFADISRKNGIRELIQDDLFDRIIVLSNRKGPGTIESIQNIADFKKEGVV
ncbi:MAG: stage III sporulation protein AA [Clostridia bacterium]|nr:stage III sporulation protein AA [Clostridia bacterium]